MANYIYKTSIYHQTDNVVGLPSSNATDLSDFETNHMGTCLPITGLSVSETSFEIDKTYSEFDALVASPYAWSDVKCMETDKSYVLYLITGNAL